MADSSPHLSRVELAAGPWARGPNLRRAENEVIYGYASLWAVWTVQGEIFQGTASVSSTLRPRPISLLVSRRGYQTLSTGSSSPARGGGATCPRYTPRRGSASPKAIRLNPHHSRSRTCAEADRPSDGEGEPQAGIGYWGAALAGFYISHHLLKIR